MQVPPEPHWKEAVQAIPCVLGLPTQYHEQLLLPSAYLTHAPPAFGPPEQIFVQLFCPVASVVQAIPVSGPALQKVPQSETWVQGIPWWGPVPQT